MARPDPAFTGDQPYIFVCYSHDDTRRVHDEIAWLQSEGFNVWYDEGIAPGDRFSDELAARLAGCALVLFFVTPRSVRSANCYNEIRYALDAGRRVVPLYLKRAELPEGLKLMLGSTHSLKSGDLGRSDLLRKLRQALDGPADAAVPTRGQPRRPQIGRPGLLALAATLLIGLTVTLYLNWRGPAGSDDPRVIAVLPFANVTGDVSLEYLADGLAEEVLNSLTQMSGVQVVSRTSAFSFKGQQVSLEEIGDALGADMVVEGSVRSRGGEMRVTASLVDTDTGYQRWSDAFDSPNREIFSVQRRIATAVADTVARELGMPASDAAGIAEPADPRAYDLYLRGRHLWHQRGREGVEDAVDLLHEAVLLDPGFARGWAGLSAAYLTQPGYDRSIDAKTARTRAETAAGKALSLDGRQGEAQTVLAAIASVRGRWLDAETRFRLALESTTDPATAHYWYSEMLTKVGRVEDALLHVEQAIGLNPLNAVMYIDQGFNRLALGRLDAASEAFQRAQALGLVHMQLWFGQLAIRMLREDWTGAQAWLEQRPIQGSTELEQAWIDARREDGAEQVQTAVHAVLAALRARRTDPKFGVYVLADVGAFDAAIGTVRALHENGYSDWRALWSPGTAALREWPAFHAVVDEIGLVEYWESNGWSDFCFPREAEYTCAAQARTAGQW